MKDRLPLRGFDTTAYWKRLWINVGVARRVPRTVHDFAVSCCCKPRRSIVAHRSTILPSRMRQNTIPVNLNARFATGTGIIGSGPGAYRSSWRARHAVSFGHDVLNLDPKIRK
jgi:hypothetical protein